MYKVLESKSKKVWGPRTFRDLDLDRRVCQSHNAYWGAVCSRSLPSRWTRTGGSGGCCCWLRDRTSTAAAWRRAAGVWRSRTWTGTRSCRSWSLPARRWASDRPPRRSRRRGPSATSPRTNRATTTTSAGASLSVTRARGLLFFFKYLGICLRNRFVLYEYCVP